MGYKNSQYSHTDKTQAAGSFTQEVNISRRFHQVAVETPGPLSAGELKVYGLPVGATKYVYLGTFDLTDGDDRLSKFEGWFTSLRFVPDSIPTDVTFDVYGYSVTGDK